MSDLKKQFEEELKSIEKDTVLSPAYRRKKLIIYTIRTSIAIVLFYLLWKNEWAKWLLILYIPLNLISLISIFGWNYFLSKKIEKTKQSIEELDEYISEEE